MLMALFLALLKTGSSIAAKMAMMAMTTSSSINVKPRYDRFFFNFILQLLLFNGGGGLLGPAPACFSY